MYFLLAVSTNHGSLSLGKPRKRRLHAGASDLILGMIGSTVSSLTKALVENLLRGKKIKIQGQQNKKKKEDILI